MCTISVPRRLTHSAASRPLTRHLVSPQCTRSNHTAHRVRQPRSLSTHARVPLSNRQPSRVTCVPHAPLRSQPHIYTISPVRACILPLPVLQSRHTDADRPRHRSGIMRPPTNFTLYQAFRLHGDHHPSLTSRRGCRMRRSGRPSTRPRAKHLVSFNLLSRDDGPQRSLTSLTPSALLACHHRTHAALTPRTRGMVCSTPTVAYTHPAVQHYSAGQRANKTADSAHREQWHSERRVANDTGLSDDARL